MGADYYADKGGRMSEENKVIDTFGKLQDNVNKIHGTVLVMQNVIKGLDTPCGLCIGCEVEDGRKGVCESFILKEKKNE